MRTTLEERNRSQAGRRIEAMDLVKQSSQTCDRSASIRHFDLEWESGADRNSRVRSGKKTP